VTVPDGTAAGLLACTSTMKYTPIYFMTYYAGYEW
jgi:hypothetical protein